ncbi:MAG: flagellar biosynthesis anti-sigma factor FlgM [Oscillospiraceae bacterium]|jgi:hypothetical protein|nr:flagellar biosynthesis anti-sigma factor FlgM [Oscillospiraceae bacterium]
MKINPVAANAAISGYRAGKPGRPADTGRISAPDEVSFSREGLAFAGILADAKAKIAAPEISVDADAIRADIQSGRYGVPARDVADSILSALK